MSIPRFFVSKDEIKADFAIITDTKILKHIKALRLRPKERIYILDGESEFEAEIERCSADSLQAHILSSRNIPRLPANITLFQGIPKHPKMETVIEACCSYGITEIVPLLCERSVAKGMRLERLRKVAYSSSALSGRLTKISEVTNLTSLKRPKEDTLILVAWEEEKKRRIRNLLPLSKPNIWIVIGPEGGLTDKEVAYLEGLGGISICLFETIFKTEYAGLILITAILYELSAI
jgi:16S rRNA (uracil1498-N3)-methyltransferase